MSIVVQYRGQRRRFKVAGSSPLQSIVTEIAEAFSLDSSSTQSAINLTHRGRVIDTSKPFNMTGLSNNVELDLVEVVGRSKTAAASGVCKIALSVEGQSSSILVTIASSITLRGLLIHLIKEGKLDSSVLNSTSAVIYMRQSYSGEALDSTTLEKMGLTGFSTRLQLRYTPEFSANAEKESIPMEVVNEESAVEAVSIAVLTSDESYNLRDDILVNDSTAIEEVSSSSIKADETSRESGCEELIRTIVSCNPPDTATRALRTITTALCNVISFPKDIKYRTIRTQNKAFQEKVAVATGATDLLEFIGFTKTGDDEAYELPLSAKPFLLSDLLMILNKTVLDLEESEKTNAATLASVVSQFRADMQTPSQPDFDPFRSTVFRTALQPGREKSITDMQLEEMAARRRQIEGEIPVDLTSFRNTQVLFPSTQETKFVSEMNEGIADEKSEPGDGRLLAAGLASKVLAAAEGPNEAPLLTRAVRELEAAKKTKVYAHTVVRARFPDRVVLQARFHPREPLVSLYTWVASQINESLVFELYTTPPRQVISTVTKLGEEEDTLLSMHFVPAALVHVAWRGRGWGARRLPR